MPPFTHLQAHQVGILPIQSYQFIVAALFDNVSFIKHNNQVSLSNGGEAVGDNESRPAAHQLAQRLHDQALRLGIQSGCRFVQNKQGRVAQKGAGDSDPLSLAAGERATPFAYDRVISVPLNG